MKLPFFSKAAEKKEFYLGLFLKEEKGIALVMVKNGENIEIKEKENFSYTNGWENLSDDVDEILYRFEKRLNVQLARTIFFVYSHLVDDKTNDIKKPYLDKIKVLVKNLELEAMGYIECFEAVTFYLEKKEETPLTAVLLELDEKQMAVFVYKGGKMIFKNVSSRTDSIVDDLTNATQAIKGKALLPSKIVIYDSGSVDDAAAKIISHRFEEGYFVQIPKISILKEEEILAGFLEVFSGQVAARQPVAAPVEKKDQPGNAFGFVVGEDISGDIKQEEELPVAKPKTNFKLNIPQLPKIAFPKINLSFFKGRVGIIFGILIIVFGLFLNEYFFHKAQLTVYLPAQTIEKTLTESVDYKVASVSADLSASAATTGTKEIGDRAQGTVTIHNFDDQDKTFSKGTTLTAAGLSFLLDGDVKVASSTLAADGSAKLPGKSDGQITAAAIGPDSNLSQGTRFAIDNESQSLYFAINAASLSGGSKKEVRTVSLQDQKNLEKTVLNNAKNQISAPSFSSDEVILTQLSNTGLADTNFSKEVGEEADSVTLKAKVESTYFAYNKSSLLQSLLNDLKNDVKQGYDLKPENIVYDFKDVKKNKNALNLNLDVKAKAVKEFDSEAALNKILFQNQTSLENILKTQYQIQGYDVSVSDPLPILNKFMPLFRKNISLKISSL